MATVEDVSMDTFPLTPSQAHSLVAVRSLADTRISRYVVPVVLGSRRRLEERRLRDALGLLTRRHAALRLRLTRTPQGEYRQVLSEPRDDEGLLGVVDIGSVPPAEHTGAIARIFEQMAMSFDLAEGPLFRVALVRTGGDDVLVLGIHHLACDTASVVLLVRDLQRAYDGDRRPVDRAAEDGYASYLRKLHTAPGAGDPPPAQAWWLDRPWFEVSQPACVDTGAMFGHGPDESFATSMTFTTGLPPREFEAHLLSALSAAMFEVCGSQRTRLDVMHHGRRQDTRNVVGWITRAIPHLLSAGAGPDVHLKEIDETRGMAPAWEEAQARIRANDAGLWETICRTGHMVVNVNSSLSTDGRRDINGFYYLPHQVPRLAGARPWVYPIRLVAQRSRSAVDFSWRYKNLFRDRRTPQDVAAYTMSRLRRLPA